MGTEAATRGGHPASVPISLIISALLLLSSAPLKASEDDGFDIEFSDGFIAAITAAIIAEATLDITSLVFAVGNMAYAASDRRPSSTWINGGFVCGGLNIVEGIVMLSIAAGSDFGYGLGFAHLVLGALNIGLSAWSSTKPKDGQPHVSLSPMILVDQDGSPAVGVGLQVINW